MSLNEIEGKQLLAAAGIVTPKGVLIGGPADVQEAMSGLRFPVVVKVVSRDIVHKSDSGGVKVNLCSVDDVEAAIKTMQSVPEIRNANVEGFLIEEMAGAGQEIVIGGVEDPQFGPLIMVGLGGIFVEVLGDVAFRICPISRLDAEEMLADLKGIAILDGARGRAPVSRTSVIEALLKIGGQEGLLMRHRNDFAEVDINPLIVSASGAVAVDARFILATSDRPQ